MAGRIRSIFQEARHAARSFLYGIFFTVTAIQRQKKLITCSSHNVGGGLPPSIQDYFIRNWNFPGSKTLSIPFRTGETKRR